MSESSSAPAVTPTRRFVPRRAATDAGSPEGIAQRGLTPDEGPIRTAGPLLSVLRHPRLVILPVLLVLGGALAFTLQRVPAYTAEAQILVGRVDVEANAVPGFVSANQTLAATYARLVSTTVIASRVAAALDVPVSEISGDLAGDPIPESSLIKITASSPSQERAVALAATTSTELIKYLNQTNDNPARQKVLLEEYRAAAEQLQVATLGRVAAESALGLATAAQEPESQAALARARAAVDQASLSSDTAAQAYRESQRGAADRGTLNLVSESRTTGSDRARSIQLAVVTSLMLGGLLGLGLATLKENRSALRELRRRAGVHS